MSEKFIRSEREVKWVPVKNLSVVWRQSQREFDERWSKTLAETFDPDYFGVVTVCKANGANMYHVIDGQHRSVAVRELFGENECVPCNVFDVNDPKRAAEIFDKMNTRRKPPTIVASFKVRVTAGEEIESAVNAVIKSCGYHVDTNLGDGTIRAVGSCVQVYKRFGPEALRSSLKTLSSIWGKNSDAVDGSLIRGFATFFNEFGAKIDKTRLTERVGKKFTPGKLLSAAKSGRDVFLCNLADSVTELLKRCYNEGLHSNRLGEKTTKNGAKV